MDVPSTPVLVLNRHYQPIHITSVRRAFTLLYLNLAHAVDKEYRVFDFDRWRQQGANNDDALVLHTVTHTFRAPRVIVLLTYGRIPIGRVRFSRANVFARDNHTCQYCMRQMKRIDLNLDHVVPKSRGGRTSWENVVTSCVPCNLRKSARTPDEAAMRLLRPPARPKWSALIKQPLSEAVITDHRFEDWRPYLSLTDAQSA